MPQSTLIIKLQSIISVFKNNENGATENAGTENAGLENQGRKSQGWKTHDHRLWSAKCTLCPKKTSPTFSTVT